MCRGEKGPIALDTKVDWVFSGPSEGWRSSEEIVANHTTHTLRVDTRNEPEHMMEIGLKFWDLESIEVVRKEESKL